ncbi:MAG: NADH-quinone oxidoreductase subunit L, partial [Rhodospirillaceae bacterium]
MTNLSQLSWLLVALPTAGALILLIGGRRTDRWGHLLGCATVLGSFGIGLGLLAEMVSRPADDRAIHAHLFSWVPVGALHLDFGVLIDPLSICFVLLISGVGALIHIYSIGYMATDTDRRRFFAYLNLFVAAMLLLVVADNYLGLYVGWEGVGLASYLLIGFWYARPVAAAAGKKAFVSNRVGDIGLSLAMFAMFAGFGTLSFDALFGAVADAGPSGLTTAIGLLLLLGA